MLPVVFYVSNSKTIRDHNVFDRIVLAISAPVQWAVVGSFDSVSTTWRRYIDLTEVEEQNEWLMLENSRLENELAMREEQRLENDQLRMLVGMRERSSHVRMLFCRVVGMSPSPVFQSIRIDVGRHDGVTLGAAVINQQGVIGRVAALGEFHADIMLLVDNNSSLDVLVQRTRARARVRGYGDDQHIGVDVQYIARTADVEPGDVLITSGLGSVFPKGLRVGRVTRVEKRAFGLYQQASVIPYVDFTRLEMAMVILGGWSKDTDFESTATPPVSSEPDPATIEAIPMERLTPQPLTAPASGE